jgi:hypothetical protein
MSDSESNVSSGSNLRTTKRRRTEEGSDDLDEPHTPEVSVNELKLSTKKIINFIDQHDSEEYGSLSLEQMMTVGQKILQKSADHALQSSEYSAESQLREITAKLDHLNAFVSTMQTGFDSEFEKLSGDVKKL